MVPLNTSRRRLLGAAVLTATESAPGGGAPARAPAYAMECDADGAPHLEPSAYANRFSGQYARRTVAGGVGHSLPQEARGAFARAVLDAGAS